MESISRSKERKLIFIVLSLNRITRIDNSGTFGQSFEQTGHGIDRKTIWSFQRQAMSPQRQVMISRDNNENMIQE